MVNRAQLIKQLNYPAEVFVFDKLNSTNDYLANQHSQTIQICLTNEQTNGRGRFNRAWLSHKNSSIYIDCRIF